MAFNISALPKHLVALFADAQTNLASAIQVAVAFGYKNAISLTDLIFFLKHPERKGAALKTHEKALIDEWKAIHAQVKEVLSSIVLPAPTGAGPLWLKYAQQEKDSWGTSVESDVDTDEGYFMASPFYGNSLHADGEIPRSKNLNWCAAFVNWCLHRAGYSHTGSAGDDSFRSSTSWHFDALEEPQQGCVIVLGNTKTQTNSNHVTFLWDWKNLPKGSDIDSVWVDGSKRCHCLGGNQNDRVQIKDYYSRKLFSAKGRNGVRSPYLWPLRGSGTCGIESVPTSNKQHYCRHNPVAVAAAPED